MLPFLHCQVEPTETSNQPKFQYNNAGNLSEFFLQLLLWKITWRWKILEIKSLIVFLQFSYYWRSLTELIYLIYCYCGLLRTNTKQYFSPRYLKLAEFHQFFSVNTSQSDSKQWKWHLFNLSEKQKSISQMKIKKITWKHIKYIQHLCDSEQKHRK